MQGERQDYVIVTTDCDGCTSRRYASHGDVMREAETRWPDAIQESVRRWLPGKLRSMDVGDHYEGPKTVGECWDRIVRVA